MINEKKNEFWDIYNKDREMTGKIHRRGESMEKGEYHMAVHVCIFNNRKQLLIQQRQPFKKGWPNMWDLSVGGSALAGDSSSAAAERETFEELGLKIDLADTRPNFTVNFPEGFDDYYIIEQDIDINKLKLQEEEVKQVRWADKEEVLKMQEEGTMIPYWFVDKLFEIRKVKDAHGNRNSKIKIQYATQKNLASWMSLVEIVKWNFPGLETEEKMEEYQNTVINNMEQKTAICALDKNMVVGILLFSTKYNMLCCMAVHPEYRRQGIATQLVNLMLSNLDLKNDIVVETFREEDEKGVAPRAFYKSLGFVPGELCFFEDYYPEQKFVLKGKNCTTQN